MSHALYFQKLIIERDSSRNFRKYYNRLLTACKGAYQSEISGQKNLYSPYANSDLQEFWAESAEIFFEKPHELSLQYPEVYEAIKILLNQDPLNKTCPLVEQQRSYLKNLLKF